MLIVLLHDQKYQKSARRTRAVLLPNLVRRARVSRASHAWQVRAANGRAKVGGFIAPRNLILPRVRTYHTRKPSRFVHALPARPLKVQGGRGSDVCADGMESISFILSVGCAWALCVGRWLAAAVKNHKATFPFLYFCVTKSTKSHLRGFSILLKIFFRVHELVAGSSAWQVRAAKDKVKIGGFALPATSYYHACEHITRESRADSCTHCLHAR